MPGCRGAGIMIRVYPDFNAVSRAAAELFVSRGAAAVKARGRFTVALAGGETPRRTYELLAEPPYRNEVDWSLLHVFWGDERCVAPDDPLSNSLMARRALLDRVPVPASQIHPMLCAEKPGGSAREYESLLRSFFADVDPRFDLVFLGLGVNGHTASLFPESPVLGEQERWVREVFVPEQGLWRVTLTPLLINQANFVAFLVSGGSKAGVLREVLEGPQDSRRLPAQLIQPQSHGGELLWLVDQEAAQCLPSLAAAGNA